MNVTEKLSRLAYVQGDAPAIMTVDGTLTFTELDRAVSYFAANLRDEGFAPGDIVGLRVSDPVVHSISSLALARAGIGQFVLYPVDPPRLGESFRDRLGIVAAVANSTAPLVDGIFKIPPPSPDIAELKRLEERPFETAQGEDLTLFVQRTSGTTGLPKLLQVSHSVGAHRVGDFGLYGPDIRFISITSVEFEGAKQNLYRCLLAGGAFVIDRKSKFETTLDVIYRLGVNAIGLAPVHTNKLLEYAPAEGLMFPDMKWIRTGTTEVPAALRRAICERLSPNLYVSYGITEVGVVTQASPDMVERAPGIVGPPVPGVSVEIIDENEQPVAPGAVGTIRVKSPGMAPGYFQDPGATAAVFRDGWFYSGDRGEFTEDGVLIHHGRADDVIIVDGINVNPSAIEDALLEESSVALAAVFGIESPQHGSVPIAAVTLNEDISAKRLLDVVRTKLGVYAPWEVIVVEEMPTNTAGKIVKSKLVDAYEQYAKARVR